MDPPERLMTAAFSPGTSFADYRIESLVGRGGMGVVYRATDLSLERPVALKLIAPELSQDERFRSRFLREPRLAASLDHPNVIPIYEAGQHDGQLYLAMRFVEGSDLRTLLDRERKLSPERTLAILGQVGGALDAAHRRALVHRDMKPANVLLDQDDHAYLTDFGITKQLGGDSTDTGRLVGTLDYLAPEQIRGDPVDARTDCYALGCVLYECMSGKPPFRRATEAETMWAHMQEEPAPLRGFARLDPVIRKAVAKDREDRYRNCRELLEAAADAAGSCPPCSTGTRAQSSPEGCWCWPRPSG
jgi:serine/threonine protein kinase